jgi:acetate kinase
MNVLVIKCGSATIKYQVVNSVSGHVLSQGEVEGVHEKTAGFRDALQDILMQIDQHDVEAVGHRVIHGGNQFYESAIIDDDVVRGIEHCEKFAPLQIPANLAGIRAARELFPTLTNVAVFETSFHSRMPRRAANYALPQDIVEKYSIRRFGFQGPSHAIVARRAADFLRLPIEELRLISCHLDSSASVCAVEYGHSIETSMGMTPLEGLVMGTRSGDLDPGIVIHLCREIGIDATEELLNAKSGLLGVSGLGNDMRLIETKAAEGFEPARLAIAIFAHQVRKYIGAYIAVMGGVDAVVLTGGIGQTSPAIRQRILQRFEYIGLHYDFDRNSDVALSEEKPVVDISADNSRVHALIAATNENLHIAEETAQAVGEKNAALPRKPIPIAISGRHLHLDRPTMDILFGKGSELSVYKEISQPGQFASEQKVDLIGPRDRINGVRVLGPLRKKTQVEIARTDEYRLGVDAPIRRSGMLEGSAPIILEGPEGTVHLREGLICAGRHIHMHPDEAKAYGVKNSDEVEVDISGSPRDLTFRDVLVRVSDSYILEMHIDTDEANAAELNQGSSGELIYQKPDSAVTASLSPPRGKSPNLT